MKIAASFGMVLLCARVGGAWAQQVDRHLTEFSREQDGRGLYFVFSTDRPAAAAVSLLSGPDRLLIDLPDTDYSRGSAPGGGAGKGVTFCHWHRIGMTRVQCELGLPCRVPTSAVVVRTVGNRVEVDVDLNYRLKDRYRVTSGLRWEQQQIATDGRFLFVNAMSFSQHDKDAHLAVGLANERKDSREKPSSMGRRMGALAGVNGGFFASAGGPLGLVIRDRQLVTAHVSRRPPRTALEVAEDGTISFEPLVWRKDHLETGIGQERPGVVLALGAGPRLVAGGKVALTTDKEELGPRGNDITRVAARTCVSLDRNGEVSVISITGYRDLHRQGLNMEELARFLVSQGAVDAFNLDGGSSTSMFLGSHVISNAASAPPLEKAAGDALLIVDHRQQLFPANLSVTTSLPQMVGDGKSTLELVATPTTADGRAVPDGTPVRIYPEGVWTDSQLQVTRGGQARFSLISLTRVGKAAVRVESGEAVANAGLQLVPAEPAQLWARFTVPPPGDADQLVYVTGEVDDRFGNACPTVTLTLSGAPAGNLTAVSGLNGMVNFACRVPLTGAALVLFGPGGRQTLQIPAVAAPSPIVTPTPGGDSDPPIPVPVHPYLR